MLGLGAGYTGLGAGSRCWVYESRCWVTKSILGSKGPGLLLRCVRGEVPLWFKETDGRKLDKITVYKFYVFV